MKVAELREQQQQSKEQKPLSLATCSLQPWVAGLLMRFFLQHQRQQAAWGHKRHVC
jgi:hypothetical protein